MVAYFADISVKSGVTGVVQPPINIAIEIEQNITLMPLMAVDFTDAPKN